MATVQPTLAFDTLAYARTLAADGIERGQAEVLAAAMRDCVIANLATNDFVQAVVQEAKTELNHKINEVKTELNHKIDEVRAEFNYKIDEVRAEFKQEITEVKHEIRDVEVKLNHEIEKVYLAIKESNQNLKIWIGSFIFLMTGALATLMKLLG